MQYTVDVVLIKRLKKINGTDFGFVLKYEENK